MKKQLLSVVLAATMVLSLAACGSKDAAQTTTQTTETETTVTEDTTADTAEATEPDKCQSPDWRYAVLYLLKY